MKTHFLQYLNSETNMKKQTALWMLVHITIPSLLLLSVFILGSVNINTSLFDMLPRSSQSKDIMKADTFLSERNGKEIIILCAAQDFEKAKNGNIILYNELINSNKIEKINFYYDISVINDFYSYFFNFRFVIVSNDTLALLESGRAEEIAYDALADIFGAFNFFTLDNIDKDPFLLTERRAKDFLSASLLTGSMTFKDDVIAAEKDGTWYVMLRLTLAPGAVSLRADRNVVEQIYNSVQNIKESFEEIEFYFSGVPFHSYESSSSAQKEISIISTVTLSLILLLFLFVFRSAVPVIISFLAILISLFTAAAASLLIFREIHIITFVFGTTLIGTCVDYSVHFFVHWNGNFALKNGHDVRNHIIKNITMSFISTQICFIAFFIAPFAILKQFAVFSIAGLLSSYLTFFCIYPHLKIKRKKQIYSRQTEKNIPFKNSAVYSLFNKTKYFLLPVFAVIILVLLVFNLSNIKIKNNLSSLYTMSDRLLESEIKTAQILNIGSPGWYFIVSGLNQQETLENEERLSARLREEITKGNLSSFFASSLFVPSIKNQERTYQAMKALLPLAADQFEYLGFPAQYADDFEKEFASSEIFCLVKDAPSQAGISNLWIGEINGKFYSCVIPLNPADDVIFKSIADEFDFVHFTNKAKDIGQDMDTLTGIMLILFLGAYIIVSIIVFIIFPRRDSIKICVVPLLLAAGTLSVLAVKNIPISFFSVVALVLIFALSLDYIFFMTGKKSREEKNLTLLGVVLSFLTTLFSFGALALSGFTPIHIFGLTVCAGLSAAFISTMILQTKDD